MTDDLKTRLHAWEVSASSNSVSSRIERLLGDRSLPGPLTAPPSRLRLLPLACALVAGILVLTTMTWRSDDGPLLIRHDVLTGRPPVVMPGMPAAAQQVATAVSAVDLRGFELVADPRIRVDRREP